MPQISKHISDIQHARWTALTNEVNHFSLAKNPRISILAATKYGTAEEAAGLIQAGATLIGENRISDAESRLQELATMALPPFSAHFIGTLQRNKVKRALTLFSCIQSMDRDALFTEVQNECHAQGRTIDVMIQINTGGEAAKSGYSITEVLAKHPHLFTFPNIKIIGIMAVTPFFPNSEEVRPLFKSAHRLFSDLQALYPALIHLSMGMSQDYRVAIQEGATMIRIGSVLYGR
jgi:pyridoxal phosphate enzyme (YggS family)